MKCSFKSGYSQQPKCMIIFVFHFLKNSLSAYNQFYFLTVWMSYGNIQFCLKFYEKAKTSHFKL